jgi:pyruvate dehydrogenase (quinone)
MEAEMEATVADFLLKRLAAWGVHRVYGYPGDGINGIMGAFGRTEEDLEYVQTRHEEMAASAWPRPGRAQSIC